MALFSCFVKKKKAKVDVKPLPDLQTGSGFSTLQVKLEHPAKSSDHVNSTSFSVPIPFDIPENSRCNVKLMNPETAIEKEPLEVAYEGEDERDDKSPMARDNSDCNLQARDIDSSNKTVILRNEGSRYCENKFEESNKGIPKLAMVDMGHVSDPGVAREERWASPMLTRSCSSIDTREVMKKISDQLPPSKCQPFEELQELAEKTNGNVLLGSPRNSHQSADKVMLKKHSSSQVLPSRSRKLWWKLFLWSHRNLHPQNPINAKTRVSQLVSLHKQGGYSSDTLEPGRAHQHTKLESPTSLSEIYSYKSEGKDGNDVEKWDGLKGRVSGLWPQNQWVAFSGESSQNQWVALKRVEDWVQGIEIESDSWSFEDEKRDEQIALSPSPEPSGLAAKGAIQVSRVHKPNVSEELFYANSVIQSLNSSSTVAHISGMGLKVIPIISQFSSLRSVNLSNNSIVQITPGSLPRGLHVLDLSRNKISAIDGLRELTRLRVVDLSYNRIGRIGHGLSSCSLLKELYLAGNKISEIEGLHRLLKLALLDLSFNKITTTKALGQLIANYHSLLALNLLGNPILSNLSDDQLRRAVCGLLPKLAYLNKQPVNQQKAREVSMDIVNKVSSRSNGWSARRKLVKKGSPSGSLLSSTAKSNASVGHRSKNRSKSRTNLQSTLKK